MRAAAITTGSLALVAVLSACAAGGRTTSTGGVLAARTTKTLPSGQGSVCRTGTKVDLRVLKGTRGATIALAPVTIDGKGPYAFALDTGAAKSAIDSQLSKRLGLPSVAAGHHVEGVAGTVPARVVQVRSWQVGSIRLHTDTIDSIDLFGGRNGPAGLLGSDVLSRFSSICLDYKAGILRLGS